MCAMHFVSYANTTIIGTQGEIAYVVQDGYLECKWTTRHIDVKQYFLQELKVEHFLQIKYVTEMKMMNIFLQRIFYIWETCTNVLWK